MRVSGGRRRVANELACLARRQKKEKKKNRERKPKGERRE